MLQLVLKNAFGQSFSKCSHWKSSQQVTIFLRLIHNSLETNLLVFVIFWIVVKYNMSSMQSGLIESSYSSDDEEREVQLPMPQMDEETWIRADYFRENSVVHYHRIIGDTQKIH